MEQAKYASSRERQKQLLQILDKSYPDMVFTKGIKDFLPEELHADLAYLEEHGLTETKVNAPLSGRIPVAVKITAKGRDFLDESGGLTAELSTITIKVHAETLQALIAAKIEDADLPPPEKQQLIEQLKVLPAQAIEHLMKKGLDFAFDNGAPIVQWLRNALLPLS